MRILVVSQYFWPESFRINEVVESLMQVGCEIEVLTAQPNYPGGRIFPGFRAWHCGTERHDAGYDIHRVPLLPRGQNSGFYLALNYLSFVIGASTIGPWLIRGRQYDVVFVYAVSPILQVLPAVVLRRLKRATLAVWVQDLWPQSVQVSGFVTAPGLLNAIGRVTAWIYSRADLLLVQSPAFIDDVRSKAGPGIPIVYHPNPGDLALVGDAPTNSRGTSPIAFRNCFNLVLAGNLGYAQALETVLEAAELLRAEADIRIILVGSGSRSDWLREQILTRELRNVELAGRFPSDVMPTILAQASALLVTLGKAPALSQTVPSKIMTYLAAGRPIVASIDGEGARVVRNASAGVVSPAEDSARLAKEIIGLRDMPSERLVLMGNAGRAYFEKHYDPRTLASELLQHLSAAAAARKHDSRGAPTSKADR